MRWSRARRLRAETPLHPATLAVDREVPALRDLDERGRRRHRRHQAFCVRRPATAASPCGAPSPSHVRVESRLATPGTRRISFSIAAAVGWFSTSPAIVTSPSTTVTVRPVASIHNARKTSSRMSCSISSSGRWNARTRSARVRIPTSRPSLTTGTRLIIDPSITRAARATETSGSIVIAGADIASRAVRARSRFLSPYASSSRRSTKPLSYGTERSSRQRMSDSLTTPSTFPSPSQTGTPPMRCSTSTLATSFSGVSGVTATTSVVIRSFTFMPASSVPRAGLPSASAPIMAAGNYGRAQHRGPPTAGLCGSSPGRFRLSSALRPSVRRFFLPFLPESFFLLATVPECNRSISQIHARVVSLDSDPESVEIAELQRSSLGARDEHDRHRPHRRVHRHVCRRYRDRHPRRSLHAQAPQRRHRSDTPRRARLVRGGGCPPRRRPRGHDRVHALRPQRATRRSDRRRAGVSVRLGRPECHDQGGSPGRVPPYLEGRQPQLRRLHRRRQAALPGSGDARQDTALRLHVHAARDVPRPLPRVLRRRPYRHADRPAGGDMSAELEVSRRWAFRYLIASTAILGAAGTLGVLLRDSQADVGRIDPGWWYALMTAHGLGAFVGWAAFAVMGFSYWVLAQAGFPLRPWGRRLAALTWWLMV